MRYSHTQLEKFLVMTESQEELGRVHDVIYDDSFHTVVQYIVTSGMLRQKEYHIAPSQIKKITEKYIIVDDACVATKQKQELPLSFSDPNPAMMREE